MEPDKLWSLEFSQYSEDKGMFPWHIGPLKAAIKGNLQDCFGNNRKENKWQIVFIGPTFDSCADKLDELIKLKGGHRPGRRLSGKSGYVYLIRAATGHYKIGRTTSIPNRMKLFAVKLPFDFEIIHTFHCSCAATAENELHQIYQTQRVNGEWFNLNEADVETIRAIHSFNEYGEFEKINDYGDALGMPELWRRLS